MVGIKDFIKNKQELIGLALVPIPILVYWVYWVFNRSYWFNADPAAVYFFDSLSVFIGKSYVYVDHPGTPMQVIGSLLLAVTYPFFDSQESFIHFFIARPGAFFAMTNVLLLAANLFCAIVLYRTTLPAFTQNRILGAVSISLVFFTLHPYSYPSLTLWSHNSLNFPIGTLLLIWLYRETENVQEIKPSKLFLMGLLSGIFAVAQMYFFAWLVSGIFTVVMFSFFHHKSLKSTFISGMYMVVGGILGIISMLIPIYRELPRFMIWLTAIVTHLDLYGAGESGIYSLKLIPIAISFWWANIPLIMIGLLLSLVILSIFAYWVKRSKVKLPPGDLAMIIGLLFHMGLIMLIMTKAALKLRYSLSMAAILPVLVFMILKLLQSTPWRLKISLRIFYIFIIGGVIASLIGQKEVVDKRAYVEKDAREAKTHAVNRLAKELGETEEDVTVVYAYSVPLKCAGLLQAANWTGYFKDELAQICPNQFAVWDSEIELNPAAPMQEITDIDWDLVIWPGNGTNLPDYLYSIGATTIPNSWYIPRSKWFFIHSEILDE